MTTFDYFVFRTRALLSTLSVIGISNRALPQYWCYFPTFAADFEADFPWIPDIVGEITLMELAEKFYRESYIRFVSRGEVVKKYLTTDQWNVGFLPVEYITSAAVHFDLFKFDQSTLSFREPDVYLEENLKSLLHFRSGIQLDILFQNRPFSRHGIPNEALLQMARDALPLIFPAISRLAIKKIHVRVYLGFPFNLSVRGDTFTLEGWTKTVEEQVCIVLIYVKSQSPKY